jgi:hypothetical protein
MQRIRLLPQGYQLEEAIVGFPLKRSSGRYLELDNNVNAVA